MRSNPKSASLMTVTEGYRIVIACEQLIFQCCNQKWQTAAIRVMGCRFTILFEDLKVALVHRHYSEEYMAGCCIYWKDWWDFLKTFRLCWEGSQSLEEYAGSSYRGYSRYIRDLVTYLSQRADAKGVQVVECAPNLLSGEIHQGRYSMAIMFDEIVVIKEYDRSLHPCDMIKAQSEASVMAKLFHPGIVSLLELVQIQTHILFWYWSWWMRISGLWSTLDPEGGVYLLSRSMFVLISSSKLIFTTKFVCYLGGTKHV